MKRLAVLIAFALAAAALQAGPVSETPFRNNVNFYIVNTDGKPFTVTVKTDAGTMEPDRSGFASYLMLRVYGPEDALVVFQEAQLPDDDQYASLEFEVPAAGQGVYTLILTGGAPDWVGIQLAPALSYGVMGRTRLQIRAGALAKSYIYVPRNCQAAEFKIKQIPALGRRSLAVFNAKNQRLAGVRSVTGYNVARIEPKERDAVLRLEFSGRDSFEFNAAGLPGILCPTPDAAKKIHASAIYLDGATVQFHWQAKMWEWLKAADVGDFQIEPAALDADALRDAGRRAAFALGPYGPLTHVPAILAEQDLDPADLWFGSIHAWQAALGRKAPLDRWDQGLDAGYANTLGSVGVLAWAYGADISGNPYYKSKALLNRTIAAAFIQYLCMSEAEEIVEPHMALGAESNWRRYHAHYLYDGPAALLHMKDDVPGEVRDLWLDAIRRQAERLAYFSRWSTGQWSMAVLGHYFTAAVSEEERYRTLWRRHVDVMLSDGMGGRLGQAPAGYFRENERVDGGYNSMAAFYLGCLYRLTDEPEILDALQRTWGLRAHLSLPEPDGRLVSPTNFNSRSNRGFADAVYPDAALLAGIVPRATDALARSDGKGWQVHEAGDVDRAVDTLAGQEAEAWDAGALQVAAGVGGLLSGLAEKSVRAELMPLPMETAATFTASFAGDFVCVRRPAYYAVIYTAPRAGALHAAKVMQGGGLSALWTPACGAAILSANDGPWFNHAVTGTDSAGRVVSSSFANQEARLSDDGRELRVLGRIPSTPLTYDRVFRFGDDALEAKLTVKALREWRGEELYEVVPFMSDKSKRVVAVGSDGLDAELSAELPQTAAGFAIVTGRGRVDVRFSKAVELVRSKGTGKSHRAAAGHVRVVLPKTWAKGQTVQLTYRIVPTAGP